jgi:hypothetical protein
MSIDINPIQANSTLEEGKPVIEQKSASNPNCIDAYGDIIYITLIVAFLLVFIICLVLF